MGLYGDSHAGGDQIPLRCIKVEVVVLVELDCRFFCVIPELRGV